MFGPFRPTSSLSVGLLWKTPWRLSAPRKLRHRRRLRHVDNVVAVLDTALRRQHALAGAEPLSNGSQTSPDSSPSIAVSNQATDAELATTAEGQRLLTSRTQAELQAMRRGRGPKRGDLLPAAEGEDALIGEVRTTSQAARENGTIKLLERWKADMPTEGEMLSRDKYTLFDRKERGYRKGIHKLPKWTRVSQRLNPPGF